MARAENVPIVRNREFVTVTNDRDLEAVATLLSDGVARTIIVETNRKPLSAAELKDRCDASGPTVYRRLEDLRDCDLVAVRTRPDPDGNHRDVYVATLDRVVVDLLEEGFDLRVSRRESMADRFTAIIEGM